MSHSCAGCWTMSFQWAGLSVRRVEPAGTDNAIFRLGEEWLVRLARRKGPTRSGGKEFDWLPRLAPLVPLEIPLPVAQGRPTDEYRGSGTSSRGWRARRPRSRTSTRPCRARPCSVRRRPAAGGSLGRADGPRHPPGRARRGDPVLASKARRRSRGVGGWERALATPAWEGPPVWHHGDLDVRNWLVRDGRICAVIDWEAMGVGDPACDVMLAWKLHSAEARDAFREALPTDDATWERARGWALSQAVAALAYYTTGEQSDAVSRSRSMARARALGAWLSGSAPADRQRSCRNSSARLVSNPWPPRRRTAGWSRRVVLIPG